MAPASPLSNSLWLQRWRDVLQRWRPPCEPADSEMLDIELESASESLPSIHWITEARPLREASGA